MIYTAAHGANYSSTVSDDAGAIELDQIAFHLLPALQQAVVWLICG
jgi:hypothetical protein